MNFVYHVVGTIGTKSYVGPTYDFVPMVNNILVTFWYGQFSILVILIGYSIAYTKMYGYGYQPYRYYSISRLSVNFLILVFIHSFQYAHSFV